MTENAPGAQKRGRHRGAQRLLEPQEALAQCGGHVGPLFRLELEDAAG